MNELTDQARVKEYEELEGLYDDVLFVVNRALHGAKNYSIAILRLENPSYSQIAEQLEKVCELMEIISDDLPEGPGLNHVHTLAKAKEYTAAVARIAKAITDGDEQAVRRLCDELDRRPFL